MGAIVKHELQGIDEAKFGEMAALLKARTGIVLTGNEGTAEKQGFVVRYRYDADARKLELELLKKPWFVPQSLIDSKIAEYMKSQGQAFLDEPSTKML